MKLAIHITALVAIFVAVHICSAQQSVTNGSIRVTFPTADWAVTDPPAELRDTYDSTRSPLKLIFHSISQSSRLRFYITQFDYPSDFGDLTAGLAGYLDGVRNRCVRQASGDVTEEVVNINSFPVRIFDANVSGGMFIEIGTVLCTDRVYSLEISGPVTSRQEAKQCLNGFSLVGEAPLQPSVVEGILNARAKTGGAISAYENGRRAGYALGFVLTASVVVVALVLVLKRKTNAQNSSPLTSAKIMAPPIPSSLVPPIIQSKSKPDNRVA